MRPALALAAALCAAVLAASLPAAADDRSDFAAANKACTKTDPDPAKVLDCLGDQVLSADGHLGDILAETTGFVTPAQAAALKHAQKDWASYRASTCAYHKGRATAEDAALAELFCLFRITNGRIDEIQANDDFAKPVLPKKK